MKGDNFYIACYIYHDILNLETHHVPAVDDFHTRMGEHTTTLSSAGLDELPSRMDNRESRETMLLFYLDDDSLLLKFQQSQPSPNTLTAPLQRGRTPPPMSVLIMTLNNLMVRLL